MSSQLSSASCPAFDFVALETDKDGNIFWSWDILKLGVGLMVHQKPSEDVTVMFSLQAIFQYVHTHMGDTPGIKLFIQPHLDDMGETYEEGAL